VVVSRALNLSGPESKVKRAKQHITDLESLIGIFKQSNPWSEWRYTELDSGDWVVLFQELRPIPPTFASIIGDAIHNLRSALDHLAWELVESNGGTGGDETYFPISKDARSFKATFQRKIQGASNDSMRLIKAMKPYQGGDDRFWWLHRLDIWDKHRVLVPAVVFADSIGGWGELDARYLVDTGGILEDRAPLYRVPAAERDLPNVNMNPQFTYEIAFGKTEVTEGEPVLELLNVLLDLVDGNIQLAGATLP
jgi:hypothetical protein